MTPEQEKRLVSAVERMPAFPRSVQKVIELSTNINCRSRDLVAVIETDPVMTMKILRVINSAYYGLASRVTSVNQSVVYLGMNTVKNLAIAFAAVGIMPLENRAGFDTQRYLQHSLSTAVLARKLCHTFLEGVVDAGDCFVAGLLHDFGKVVFAQYLSTEFSQALAVSSSKAIPLYQAEREVIGVDHSLVGAMLAERWQFSDRLVDCIRLHHEPIDSSIKRDPMLDCLMVADQICRGVDQMERLTTGWGDGIPAVSPLFGADLGAVLRRVGDLTNALSEMAVFTVNEKKT